MAKPISRKDKIINKARAKRLEVQSRKLGKLVGNLDKLEKRLKKLEDKQ